MRTPGRVRVRELLPGDRIEVDGTAMTVKDVEPDLSTDITTSVTLARIFLVERRFVITPSDQLIEVIERVPWEIAKAREAVREARRALTEAYRRRADLRRDLGDLEDEIADLKQDLQYAQGERARLEGAWVS